MAPTQPLTQKWPGTQALMLVHGVGDYHPGDYDGLLTSLERVLGPERWHNVAVYPFFYDEINDWMVQKTQLKSAARALASEVKSRIAGVPLAAGVDADALGDAFSEGVADVLWPALSRDARLAILDAMAAQVLQMRVDGAGSGVPRWQQHVTILCHSLGCLHTYELLHAAASNPIYKLQPVSDWARFANVIMFASPVHLYQSVGLSALVRPFVPAINEMAVFNGPVRMPGQIDMAGRFQRSVENFVSVTGAYDPVGGFLLDHKLDWAYMDMPGAPEGFRTIVDPQADLPFATAPEELTSILGSSLVGASSPRLPLQNPHSWERYVTQNSAVIQPCFA